MNGIEPRQAETSAIRLSRRLVSMRDRGDVNSRARPNALMGSHDAEKPKAHAYC
jgi:hypothetical protein